MDTEHNAGADRGLLLTRLGVGLIQGLALFGLSEAAERKVWPVSDRPLFIALVVLALAAGPVILSGLGSLKRRALIVWSVVALSVVAAVGWMEGYRGLDGFETIPSPLVMVAVLVGLFIAHSLIVAAARDRARIAGYPTYFDVSWKHGVQLVLALAFTGIFWAVLGIGAALFGMIGVKAFAQVIGERWFAIPSSALAFAVAVHLTDVRLGLIQGVRTVALTLLGWLLPLLAGLTLAFLLALPFTGLEPLWKTGSAAMILVGAGASLILLINAAYQDGGREKPLPVALRSAMRLGGLLLLPLTVLAAYALWLRIGQYGLTIERIIAVAGVVVGACYAVGYAIAVVLPGPVMRRLEPTNVATSIVGLVVLLALLSPLADPVRLSVDNQVSRLLAGKVKPADFDFDYLRFGSGQMGTRALDRLSKAGGDIGRLAREAKARTSRSYDAALGAEQTAEDAKVYPAGKALPEAFKARWKGLASGMCRKELPACEAFLLDLNGDGREEVLLSAGGPAVLFEQDAKGVWARQGEINPAVVCAKDDPWVAFRAGRAQVRPSRWNEIDLNGARWTVQPDQTPCLDVTLTVTTTPPTVEEGGKAGGKAK
ncbi:DUF4153 domain-containing protein [Caulobacter sp. NIBR1757]|uniref:DUF4153 domain-containing protein n=1 Tax=Caulobacter sp. NIBR1757 TaxID=3016000 RepID=UPI0022F03CBD|nr:DUF4153 domain-containing protein [Caulobacter sp. NIBR1757]